MSLRVVHEHENIHAFELNAAQWADLKQSYKSMGLRMPCCDSAAIPKTSPLGNFFFAHQRKGECTTAPESAEHLLCKELIARAAKAAGWEVVTEQKGVSPDGQEWVADVYCTNGTVKLALEVQMSPQTAEETLRRQQRYKASGVRAAWFFGPRGLVGSSRFGQETPAFFLDEFHPGHVPQVKGFHVGLSDFATALLSKRVTWHVPMHVYTYLVEYLEDICWKCKLPVKQVYGYFEEQEENFHPRSFTVAAMSKALDAVSSKFSNDELIDLGLNPIKKLNTIRGKKTDWPYVNVCLHCGAPQDNYFVGQRILMALRELPESDLADLDDRLPEGHLGGAPVERTAPGRGEWKLVA